MLGYMLFGIALCFMISGYDQTPPATVLIWSVLWPAALVVVACQIVGKTELGWWLGWPYRTVRLIGRPSKGPDMMRYLLRNGETYRWRFLSGGKKRCIVLITFESKADDDEETK